MLDFILGLFLAALAVRGWMRGFMREILDLVMRECDLPSTSP